MAADIFNQHAGGFSTRTIRVLVVDEEASDLRILRLTLEGQGYEVITCSSYDAGIQCLEKEAFDFVVVSQGSRDFEGRAVLDHAMQLDRPASGFGLNPLYRHALLPGSHADGGH